MPIVGIRCSSMAGCVTHLHDADDGEGGVGRDGLAGQRCQIRAKLEEGV